MRHGTAGQETGTVQALLLALSTGVLFSSCGAGEIPETLTFEGPVESAQIAIERGDVRLVRADPADGAITVRREVRGWRRAVDLAMDLEDGELSIRGGCRWALTCRTDLVVALPPGARVSVEVGEGEVTVDGLEGPIDAEIGVGGLTGLALTVSSLRATVASGDVALALLAPVMALDVAAAAGDVRLALPAGSYALSVTAAAGDVALDGVIDAPGAPPVDVAAARGDVAIVAAEVPSVLGTR